MVMTAMLSSCAETLTAAIQDVHNKLTKGGCQPKFHRMDNECPQQVKDYFQKRDVQYQLAPPDDHRSNATERAIHTAKKHLAAGWYSTDDNFPMYLRDKTIPQAELTQSTEGIQDKPEALSMGTNPRQI
jgi:hypothetical protein